MEARRQIQVQEATSRALLARQSALLVMLPPPLPCLPQATVERPLETSPQQRVSVALRPMLPLKAAAALRASQPWSCAVAFCVDTIVRAVGQRVLLTTARATAEEDLRWLSAHCPPRFSQVC